MIHKLLLLFTTYVSKQQDVKLYQDAEFGHLSSGFFHDLMNPITGLSLSLEELQKKENVDAETKAIIARAEGARIHMSHCIESIRRHLSKVEYEEKFSIHSEIKNVIQILDYKALLSGITLFFNSTETQTRLFGSPVIFRHIFINLISNAIDAYEKIPFETTKNKREIHISVFEEREYTTVQITDYGSGISPEHIQRIFDPFFSTKNWKTGIGLGLAITKESIERKFNGTIFVESTETVGTTFVVKIPITQ